MVSADGRVKLTDFGIAKATGKATTGSFRTATGMTVGTPNYMAPEQAMGQEVGPWTDLYSVGVMAFEMFVGQVPFHDTEEPMAVLMRQISDPIPAARSINPELDPEISDWIERLLVKDPEERTRSAHDAWDELEEIVIGLVGPRWRRSARLLEPSRRPPHAPAGPATPPPTGAALPPLMPTLDPPNWVPTGQSTAATRRLREDPPQAGTVMPEAPTRRLEQDGESRDERRGRRRGLGMAKPALALFVVLFALAAVLGSRGSQPHPSSDPVVAAPKLRVASKDLSLKVPPGWSRVRKAPDVGLPLTRAAAAAPRGRAAGPVVEFGMVSGDAATNGALLPAGFLDSIGKSTSSVPARSAVRLPAQNLQAWRYRNLSPVGAPRQVTVYTVPTSGGVATVVCAALQTAAAALGPQCDAIAGTLLLRRGTAYPVGPSDAYATLAERDDRKPGAGHPHGSAELAELHDAGRPGGGRAVAGERVRQRRGAAQRAQPEPGRQDDQRPAARGAPGRRGRLPESRAGGDRVRRRRVPRRQRGDSCRHRQGQRRARRRRRGRLQARRAGKARAPSAKSTPKSSADAQGDSDVGDSRSDDPSDDSADP